MKCPRCLNTDPSYFYKGSKGWYCRRCISFARVLIEEEQEPVSLCSIQEEAEEYVLQYPLTPEQRVVAESCAQAIHSQSVIVQAVCGSGKTEMMVETISETLRAGKKICFAIARRQVVLELQQRLQEIFPHARVIAVCGGHTQVVDGDLIVCTTHQLYRYTQAFDVLILDEPDAFPFRGNAVLHGIAKTACRGHCIYLTATPDAELKQAIQRGELLCLKLNHRPHGHPLPVPVLKCGPKGILWIALWKWIRTHREHARIIFVPTIVMAERMTRILRMIEPTCFCITSHTEDRDEVIAQYRKTPCGLIVATTVLERGVTIPGVDVCVYEANHGVFDEAGLIQMAGRAGRSFARPDGDVLFLLSERSDLAERCVRELRQANAS